MLPEREGLVPTYEWKVANKNEPWWKGETLSVAIGQSYTLVTPLQMCRMIASIATGYLVRPNPAKGKIQMPDYWVENSVIDLKSWR